METSPEIQFQGMQGTPQIEEMIAAHIAKLDQRFGRITACRVVVKAPSQHHREGGLYEVHIRLVLPEGREVLRLRTNAVPIWHCYRRCFQACARTAAREGSADARRRETS
jgi:hypothetical protein